MITLKNFKEKMIEKAKKKGGIWENFGQKELFSLHCKLVKGGYNSCGHCDKDTEIRNQLEELDQWASHFNL